MHAFHDGCQHESINRMSLISGNAAAVWLSMSFKAGCIAQLQLKDEPRSLQAFVSILSVDTMALPSDCAKPGFGCKSLMALSSRSLQCLARHEPQQADFGFS
eukprot:297393-Pelagomonas_calceolata.AAC.4